MTQAAVSLSANIAEGFEDGTLKARLTFTIPSQSSLSELQHYLILVRDLTYSEKIIYG
jgi:four helix bundle protein